MSDKSLPSHVQVWNVQPLQQQFAEADESSGDSDDAVTDESNEDDSESVDDSEQESDESEDKDWKAEFEAQQRINRSLERKSKKDLARIQALESQASQGDPDAEAEARKEIEAAALAKANARIVKAELRAAASGRLSDPDDALAFIDISTIDVDDDGEVDRDALSDEIDELIKRKPHLAAQGGDTKKTPKPDRSQGAGGKGASTAEQQFAAAMQPLM